MWKPKQRIRYQHINCDWPTEAKAAKSHLFQKVILGAIELQQRTWVPAMVPWRSNLRGEVTEDVMQWYERFAQGQPGAIVIEATGIRDIASGPLLRISNDEYIEGLTELVRRVKRASQNQTKIFIQIIDFLAIKRRPSLEKFINRFLKITQQHRARLQAELCSDDEIRSRMLGLDDQQLEEILSERELDELNRGYRELVSDTHLPHINELPKVLPDLFAAAAQRAEKAGFDGVELHYAHAYTMASFLSARNNRTDGYGGSREHRVRLPVEVLATVKAAVSDYFAVGCRLLSEECITQGSDVADACYYSVELAKAGLDFLSLSRGGKFDDAKQPKVGSAVYPYTGKSGYECMPAYISDEFGPFGRNVAPTAVVRNSIRRAGYNIPVIVAGGIHNFAQAESILERNQADIIGLARQAMADPDWFRKVRDGQGDSVRLCEYTNYCEGLDQKHKQVTCQLWDRQDLDEHNICKSHDGKRRLIAPDWSGGKLLNEPVA